MASDIGQVTIKITPDVSGIAEAIAEELRRQANLLDPPDATPLPGYTARDYDDELEIEEPAAP